MKTTMKIAMTILMVIGMVSMSHAGVIIDGKQNGGRTNGISLNGISLNGISLNGGGTNGTVPNGGGSNGLNAKTTSLSSLAHQGLGKSKPRIMIEK